MTPIKQPKAGITPDDIALIVDAFYARVRRHPRLGPIFARHIGHDDADWDPHLVKIRNFWANVMLGARTYHGNPMQVHSEIREIEGTDFAIWLDLFEDTVRTHLPTPKAEAFNILARRIGRSLQMGLERSSASKPPIFQS